MNKEKFFEKTESINTVEFFCKGIIYGQQGFRVMEIVDIDSNKRYKFVDDKLILWTIN